MAKAVMRYLHISPTKVRPILKLVKGLKVEDALATLNFAEQRAAAPVMKLINSAIANAVEQENADVDRLYVKNLSADEGPTLRRFRPRAMGRATRRRKRQSHVTVELEQK